MARKKKHPEHANHERWLVSYADFITLLFAFFVVMFAASNADSKKAGKVSQAVTAAFQEMAVFAPSGKAVPLADTGGLSATTNAIIGSAQSALNAAPSVIGGKSGAATKTITEVRAQLETVLKQELANHSVRMAEDARGLTVSLAEAGFFDPGSAVMQTKALAVIDRIASTMKPLGYNLRVEGHTDTTPIHTAQFPSNWELSTARATFLLQYLISTTGIPPQRLSAVGYGEYRPVTENLTPEGRASNRRVDLVVLGAAAEKLEPQTPIAR